MESALVDDEFATEVVETAREAIEDSLRSLTYFTRTDFEQLYLRDDLAQDADLDSFVGHEWRGYRDTQSAYQSSELGEYQYTVRAFANGYLLRVATQRRGVLVTTDTLSLGRCEELAKALEWTLSQYEADENGE